MNAVESAAVDALYSGLQVEKLLVKLFLLFSLLISAHLILARLVLEQIMPVCFLFEAVVAYGIKIALLCAPVGGNLVRLALILALIADLIARLVVTLLHFINLLL